MGKITKYNKFNYKEKIALLIRYCENKMFILNWSLCIHVWMRVACISLSKYLWKCFFLFIIYVYMNYAVNFICRYAVYITVTNRKYCSNFLYKNVSQFQNGIITLKTPKLKSVYEFALPGVVLLWLFYKCRALVLIAV